MKKNFAALLLALILAALPALAQTVDEELAAYWEKANPLYAQLEALGARQAEIYQQFGLSLDDEDSSVMEDDDYEQYVRDLGVLTEDELKRLMDVNAEIIKLSDESDDLSAAYSASADTTEQGVLENLIHYKHEKIDELVKSVADLDDKVRVAEEAKYVEGLPGLDDAARQELNDMYATQRTVEKQLEALDDTLSTAAQTQLYGTAH